MLLDLESYKKIKLLPIQEREYLDNIWDKDYGTGLYFSAFHEVGQDLNIVTLIENMLYTVPHGISDGMSMLSQIDQVEQLGIDLPKSALHIKPNLFQLLKGFFFALRSSPNEKISFKHERNKAIKVDEFFVFKIRLQSNPHSSEVLNRLSQVIMKRTINNSSSRWMIPVSLRGSD